MNSAPESGSVGTKPEHTLDECHIHTDIIHLLPLFVCTLHCDVRYEADIIEDILQHKRKSNSLCCGDEILCISSSWDVCVLLEVVRWNWTVS